MLIKGNTQKVNIYSWKEGWMPLYSILKKMPLNPKLLALCTFFLLLTTLTFAEFFETQDPLNPSMTDNSYSPAISDLINAKCDGCENTIILGDDYVVPWYRRDITDIESSWYYLWLDEHPQSYNIYTDSPYISRTQAPFSQFDSLFADEYGYEKKVMFIEQDSMGQEMRDALFGLKETLRSKYKISVETINSSSIGCNSFFKLGKRTLFIAGGRKENNAFSCYPYFEADEEADGLIQLEKNVWSSRAEDYSVLVNTNEAEVIQAFNIFIQKEDYKMLQKDALYFARRGIDACSLGGMYPGIDIIGDSCDAIGDCIFDRKWGWCSFDAAMVFVPVGSAHWGKIAKKLIDLGEEGLQFYNRWGDRAVDLMKKLDKYDDATKRKVIKQLNDFDDASKTKQFQEAGIWTTKQADKIGQTIDKLQKGQKTVAYMIVKKESRYGDEIAKEIEDTIGTVNPSYNTDYMKKRKPTGRFDLDVFERPNEYSIYHSLDLATAKKEIVSNFGPDGFKEPAVTEFVIFKGEIRPKGNVGYNYRVVPSAANNEGINFVDHDLDIVMPTEKMKETTLREIMEDLNE